MTPIRAWLGPEGFLTTVRQDLNHLEENAPKALSPHRLAGTLRHVDSARKEALSPAEALIESLHPWVAFAIMPVFALANAGVSLRSGAFDAAMWKVASGVVVGLGLGKPIGVLLASWLMLKLRIGKLPLGLTQRHLVVLGTVAGIGFTMSLFIAALAFGDARLRAAAKLGVLGSSVAATLLGLVLGRVLLSSTPVHGAAATADDAEESTDT
jgi:NhaA family Na+:H+ antiporter